MEVPNGRPMDVRMKSVYSCTSYIGPNCTSMRRPKWTLFEGPKIPEDKSGGYLISQSKLHIQTENSNSVTITEISSF